MTTTRRRSRRDAIDRDEHGALQTHVPLVCCSIHRSLYHFSRFLFLFIAMVLLLYMPCMSPPSLEKQSTRFRLRISADYIGVA